MPRTPPHLIPVTPAEDSREGLGAGEGQLQVVPKWVWAGQAGQLSSSLREGTGIGGRQWFCKAFGHMTQGLGVDRLLASSVGLCGPNWLKVGVPWPGRTDF